MRVTTAVATWEGGNDGDDMLALLALCSRIVARLSEERLLVPSSTEYVHATSIVIHGSGEIDLPDGERQIAEDLVVVRGALTGDLTVWIETAYDVWLPRGLAGAPQSELHDLNAPRLERALREIDQQLELGLYGLDGRLALVRAFRVTNMTYDDGEVIVPPYVERS